MSEIINIVLGENLIKFTARRVLSMGALEDTLVIVNSRRAGLFLQRELAKTLNKAFIPPEFLTFDDLIQKLVFDNSDYAKLSDLNAAYMLWEIINKENIYITQNQSSFALFYDWALEILKFIEVLDIENAQSDKLKNVAASARIGYDVPERINKLLENIVFLRAAFHEEMEKAKTLTKGYACLKAVSSDAVNILDFKNIVLMAPFYLGACETEIIKQLYGAGRLTVITQGSPKRWKNIKNIYTKLGAALPADAKEETTSPNVNVYSAFDGASQAALAADIVSKTPPEQLNDTLIVAADEGMLGQITAELSGITENFNVSAGYEASKTSLFALIGNIIEAQQNKTPKGYWVADIIKVFTNPLIKNLRVLGSPEVVRVLCHKLEEALDAAAGGYLSGRIFVTLDDILNDAELFQKTSETVAAAWQYVAPQKLKEVAIELFDFVFSSWENITSLKQLSDVLYGFVIKISGYSIINTYPLNARACEILLETADLIKDGKAAHGEFSSAELLNIFKRLLEPQKITLAGTPLKHLQVLGFLESRGLNFKNVIICAMTDANMPKTQKVLPLVPAEVMAALGIERELSSLEVQDYHFSRLAAGSKNLHLIYPENFKDERSRFIERIIWENELKGGAVNVKSALFNFTPAAQNKKSYAKTPEIKKYLKSVKYSYSKIDSYLRCKLEFYFKYVLGLEESARAAREATGADIGNFAHAFFKKVFSSGVTSTQVRTEEFYKKYVSALENDFQKTFNYKMRTGAYMIKEIIDYRFKRFLEAEKKRGFESVAYVEKQFSAPFKLTRGACEFEAYIDRVDKVPGGYAVIDYKTGSVPNSVLAKDFDFELDIKQIKKSIKSFQLVMYKYIIENATPHNIIDAFLYNVKNGERLHLFSGLDKTEADYKYNKCLEALKFVIDEINSDTPFTYDAENNAKCENCKYFYICR
jgi:CRISPR/Cas system-associated exonuclease Cas4 (RecB family)